MAIEKVIDVKVDVAQAQKNVEELNESFKLQDKLVNDLEKEILELEKVLNKTSKTNLAGRKKVNDAIKESKTRLKEEKQGLKDVTKDRKKANEELKEATKNQKDYSGVVGKLDSLTGGAISGIKNMAKAVGGATKGFNLLKVAIIGTGIGALVIGIMAVVKAFKSSEEGQNKFRKLMGLIGVVVGNLGDMLSNLGEGIIEVFTNPKQALIDFKDLLVENITNRFNAIIDTVGFLGDAFKKVFEGDFGGAMDSAKKAGSSYIDIFTGVENTLGKTTEALSDFIDEQERELKIAGQIADQRAKADKIERQLLIDRANADRTRAELLEKAVDKEKFSASERIAFLEEAGRLEAEITDKEIAVAKIRLQTKQQENALSKSTKEDLQEEAQLKANLINLETSKLNKQKRVTTQLVTARREEQAELDANAKSEEARIQKISDFRNNVLKKDEELYATTEEEKLQLQRERAEQDLENLIGTETEKREAKLTLDEYYDELELQLENKIAGEKKAEDDKNKEQEEQDAKDVTDAKIGIANAGLNVLGAIAEEGSALSKGVAVAQATMNTYQGITAALSTVSTVPDPLGQALKVANAISVGVMGLMNVKKILATKPVEKTAPNISLGAGGGAPAVPSFNLVEGSADNQIANSLNDQNQQPIKAYVVTSDVTSGQEMDRNIIENSSL
jgi:chromosome segregation ATPase